MELFQVNDNQNNGIKVKGFDKKADAKAMRDGLQAKEKSGLPEQRDNQTLWRYTVGYGKDHPKYART